MDILIDSGSVVSLISKKVAHDLKLTITPLTNNQQLHLFSANGTKMVIEGTTDIRLYLGGLIIMQTVRVCSNIQDSILLGLDFFKSNSVILNYELGILSLNNDSVRIPLHSKTEHLNNVTVARNVCIPAFAEAIIGVKSPARFNNKTVLLEPLPIFQFRNTAVARSITACKDNNTVCRILNCKPFALTLRKGMRVAKIENINTIASIKKFDALLEPEINSQMEPRKSKSELDAFHKNYGFKVNPDLTETQRYQLLLLLYEHKEVFARDLSEIQECRAQPMQIDSHKPQKMFKRQFRLSEDDQKEVAKQIEEMKKFRIIEEADTPWYNSSVFVVKKGWFKALCG